MLVIRDIVQSVAVRTFTLYEEVDDVWSCEAADVRSVGRRALK
jgi:hypothetical protein